jgi:DNA-binding response OmpR family regulator
MESGGNAPYFGQYAPNPMKILIAHRDAAARNSLVKLIGAKAEVKIVGTADGIQAWEILSGDDAPRIAVLDWELPHVDGVEICRRLRKRNASSYTNVMLLGTRADATDVATAFGSGADDYVSFPTNVEEVVCRLQAGVRVAAQEESLSRIVVSWRTMLDSLPFGIACLASDGQLLRANQTFVHLLGYQLGDLIGANPRFRESVRLNRIIPNSTERSRLLDAICQGQPFDHMPVDMMRENGMPHRFVMWGRPMPQGHDRMFQIVVAEA